MLAVLAQNLVAQITIKGTISDAQSREPLGSATLQVVGNKNGTISNQTGQFTLQVPQLPITLVASFLGYQTQRIVITNSSPLSIKLFPTAQEVAEVEIFSKDYALDFVQRAFIKAKEYDKKKMQGNIYFKSLVHSFSSENLIYTELLAHANLSYSGISYPVINEGRSGHSDKVQLDSMKISNRFLMNSIKSIHLFFPPMGQRTGFSWYFWHVPVQNNANRFFTFRLVEIRQEEGQSIAQIEYIPKPSADNRAPTGKLYINTKTLQIFRFTGSIAETNQFKQEDNGFKYGLKQQVIATHFDLQFEPFDESTMLPKTVEVTWDAFVTKIDGSTYQSSGSEFAFIYGYEEGTTPNPNPTRNAPPEYLTIDKASYDSEFWHNNTIFAHTPIEEQVIADFEANGKFGKFVLPSKHE